METTQKRLDVGCGALECVLRVECEGDLEERGLFRLWDYGS